MLAPENNKLSFYRIKRQINTLFMSIGLFLGMTLILLQLYINQSVSEDIETNNWIEAGVQVTQPIIDVLSNMMIGQLIQGVL